MKKPKTPTQIKKWNDDYINTWYFALPEQISKQSDRKIKKEANWPTKLAVMPDIGPSSFKQLKTRRFSIYSQLNEETKKNTC